MTTSDPRTVLARLIEERREDFASLSRLIGRNPAYVQQFIKRGTPRKLGERERGLLARYFSIDEEMLGGPPPRHPVAREEGLIQIQRYDVSASAGPGALDGTERPLAHIGLDARFLARISSARPRDLSMIRVEGESMVPTLGDGDDIMVDHSAARRRLVDGIYVLRREDTLLVKRITMNPTNGTLTVASDNASFTTWPEVKPDDLEIIGRVVWAARRVA